MESAALKSPANHNSPRQPVMSIKLKRISTITNLVLLFLISGCITSDQGISIPTASPTDLLPESIPSNPPTETREIPTPSATPAPPPEILSKYTLSAVLDYDTHLVQVDEQVSYINTTGSELSELLLLVEPNIYPGGFTLNTLTWEDGIAISDFALNSRELVITLPENLLPGTSVGINLSYQLNLPNQNAPYGYTERQTNLGDWYPYVPPYVPGEGWLVRDDAFLGEHLAYDMSEFLVHVQLANPFSANGLELVLAASSEPTLDGEKYRFHHAPARNFAWSVSDLYQVLETQVGGVQVKSYSFPYHPAADVAALEESAKSLEIFNDLFGPYPHQSLSVVEADFLDGMEFDGLIYLSHAFYDYYSGDQRSNLTIIAAHEVAHQWFYGLVGNDQAMEPWLDEALSTFSEVYFYEQAYPELVDWYWENRIYFHNPEGWVDSTIYEAEGYYPYRYAVYLRGAMFLNDLRSIMGQGDFLIFLRDYLDKYRARQVSGDDFFNLLSAHTAEDLSGLIATYFSRR
jgi:hypothetical protein